MPDTIKIEVRCSETLTYAGQLSVPAKLVDAGELNFDGVQEYLDELSMGSTGLTPVTCECELSEATICPEKLPEILSCPWCSSADTVLGAHAHDRRRPAVWCEGCGAAGPCTESGACAVNLWNELSRAEASTED